MKFTFKDWLIIREQKQTSGLLNGVSTSSEDDDDKLVNQAKMAVASTIGQPGVNDKTRASQIRRIAQGSAGKKGVKLASVVRLAKAADELAKSSNNSSSNPLIKKPNSL